MTYSKSTTLWCDGDSCETWETYNRSSVSAAVHDARRDGWTSPSWDEHYCPECSGGSDGA
jgi:hypothetical protein